MNRLFTLIFFIFFIAFNLKAEALQDSLLAVWNNHSVDNNERFNALSLFLENSLNEPSKDIENSLQLSYELKNLAIEIDSQNNKAKAHYFIASFYRTKGNYKYALYNFKKALTNESLQLNIYKSLGFIYLENYVNYDSSINYYNQAIEIHRKSREGLTYLNNNKIYYDNELSNLYNIAGKAYLRSIDYKNAIKYQEMALNICDTSNKEIYSNILTELGHLYATNFNYKLASQYIEKSLSLRKSMDTSKINILALIAWSYSDIGFYYFKNNKTKKALNYFNNAILTWDNIIQKDNNLKNKVNAEKAKVYLSIGKTLNALDKAEDCQNYYYKSYNIFKEIFEKDDILKDAIQESYQNTIIELAKFQFELENYQYALQFLNDHKELFNSVHSNIQLNSVQTHLYYKIFKNLNQPKKALEYFEHYTLFRDSTKSNDKIKEINKFELKLKAKQDSINNAHQKEIAAKEYENDINEKEKKQLILQIGIVALFLLLCIGLWSYSQKKKANHLISIQKQLVEEKNKDIIDSMNYARRIQSAILPPNSLIQKQLPNSFIFYLPKDIVAGDFYWLETLGKTILFAVADCTGHGIPGAMVSVIGNNSLNRSVREHKLTKPGKVLDKAREILIKEFEKSEQEVKDGMDISLCAINGNQLEFAGANNPLWIVRNGELIETRGDKQPIGKYDDAKPFTNNQFDLQKEDTIYIFSDGFADQFGGEKGKKFKKANFKKLLLSIQDQTMSEQKVIIEKEFKNWKGQHEQIDDVCVMGLRI